MSFTLDKDYYTQDLQSKTSAPASRGQSINKGYITLMKT